ncbi:putative Major facilitator superfamily (MFS) profile domain-containing protein [Seiridium cardinale]|uniref:Major facilitator superfamily (MFS) profile domain-containing protein n=1 Tax=Seiridium cardinale TaxID=138064 RepID=A0ABR2XVG8_9PEZI
MGPIKEERGSPQAEEIQKRPQSCDGEDDASSVSPEALGNDLPQGYFYSLSSMEAMAGFCLSAISAYIFLLIPTNILTDINADIEPSPYVSWVNIARTLALSFTCTILGRR